MQILKDSDTENGAWVKFHFSFTFIFRLAAPIASLKVKIQVTIN